MRSTLTAGIALAGAGAIAMSPISPVPRHDAMAAPPHVASASVALTALADEMPNPFAADPLTAWLDVFGATSENLAQMGRDMADHPFPVLQQVIANQAGYGQLLAESIRAAADSYLQFFTSDEDYRMKYFAGMALDYLSAGNIAGAASVLSNVVFRLFAFANPLINTIQIPLGMGRNLMNALSTVPDLLMPLGLGVLNPVEGVINVLGDSAQNVLDAVDAGDPGAAFTALVNTPAVLTGAILNGYYNGIAAGTSGLLSASSVVFNRGVVESLLVTVPQTIATAIGWQKPSPAQLPVTAPPDESTTRTDVAADTSTDSTPVPREAPGAPVSRPAVDLTRISDSTAAVKTVTPQRTVAETRTEGAPTAERAARLAKNTGKSHRDAAKHKAGGAKHRAGGNHSR